VVAIAAAAPAVRARPYGAGWLVGAAVVVLAGIAVRLVVGGVGVGERSAVVMSVLLTLAAWLAALLLRGPRVALLVALAATALLDVAALPPRDTAPYDDLQAFYRTDQVLSATLPVSRSGSALNLLVQPVFAGAQPRFGLAGEVNGTAYRWSCAFAHGIQTVALPVTVQGDTADVRLQLTGAPARDGDYLIVYMSSRLGGYVISLGSPQAGATRCTEE
jgi:hypothetical protein